MHKLPGFDPLRLVAASAVVFTHAFLIAEGVEENEPFQHLTGQNIGLAGVYVFFVLSGYLISESARQSQDLSSFAIRRAARILPGFLVCNLVVTLVVGVFFGEPSGREFLTQGTTWWHLFEVYAFQAKNLYYDGVLFYPATASNDWMPHLVNGVLWTIRQEITCYLFVAMILVLGLHGWRAAGIAIVSTALLASVFVMRPSLWSVQYLSDLAFVAPSFAAGVCLNAFGRRHLAKGWGAAALTLVLLILALAWEGWAARANLLFPVLAAYPLLYIGQRDAPILRSYARGGDPSYGIYLWGWPITQMLRAYVGPGWTGYELAALALPVVIGVGYASWFLIEKPVLRAAGRQLAQRRLSLS